VIGSAEVKLKEIIEKYKNKEEKDIEIIYKLIK